MIKRILAILFIFLPTITYAAELPPIILQRVPPGWVAEEESYVMNEEALRTTYAAIATYKQERNAWENAYHELNRTSSEYAISQEKKLANLESILNAERDSWRQMIRRARMPGVGIFAGAGYTGTEVKFVIGVGAVWRLF
jgi:hypothetical protein